MTDEAANKPEETSPSSPSEGAPEQAPQKAPAPRRSKKFAGPTKTVLNRTWLIKVVVMMVALFAFGSWGLYDAIEAYPQRGERYAAYAQYEYLLAAREADENEEPGVLRREASVEDPVAELAELRSVQNELRTEASAEGGPRYYRASMELQRLEWLTALSRIGAVLPERTAMDAPRQTLAELEERWKAETPPSPLAVYDIPSQWAIMVVCYGFGAYLVFLFVTVSSKSYRWDPEVQRLTFPDGSSIVPADLEEVDKRKWDKFIVYLKVKSGHDRLGGQAVKVDTYRYALLEDWILDMEQTAFGSEEQDDDVDGSDEAAEVGEPAKA